MLGDGLLRSRRLIDIDRPGGDNLETVTDALDSAPLPGAGIKDLHPARRLAHVDVAGRNNLTIIRDELNPVCFSDLP